MVSQQGRSALVALIGFPWGTHAVAGQLPSAVVKRRLLYGGDVHPEELIGVARGLLAAEHYTDALSFLERAGAAAEIEALAGKASELGDLFLYEACCRLRGREPDVEELARLGETARVLGKLSFARKAFRLAGREAEAEALDRQILELTGQEGGAEHGAEPSLPTGMESDAQP
jgi:hypothetical protein